ncbi:hypothetical protein BGX28_001274 [Mortierella sp. GBA30]|nr:hypothetical protein BGX28_001274 [Mortierella sp. GBA30]
MPPESPVQTTTPTTTTAFQMGFLEYGDEEDLDILLGLLNPSFQNEVDNILRNPKFDALVAMAEQLFRYAEYNVEQMKE